MTSNTFVPYVKVIIKRRVGGVIYFVCGEGKRKGVALDVVVAYIQHQIDLRKAERIKKPPYINEWGKKRNCKKLGRFHKGILKV